MTPLEIGLSVALAGNATLLVRMYRKQLILRHVFMHSSDWCARLIAAMVEQATDAIVDEVQHAAEARGSRVSRNEARGSIPDVIVDAKENWFIQKEAFQANLAKNGIAPLDLSDLDDLTLYPGRAGYKPGPYPKYRDRLAERSESLQPVEERRNA